MLPSFQQALAVGPNFALRSMMSLTTILQPITDHRTRAAVHNVSSTGSLRGHMSCIPLRCCGTMDGLLPKTPWNYAYVVVTFSQFPDEPPRKAKCAWSKCRLERWNKHGAPAWVRAANTQPGPSAPWTHEGPCFSHWLQDTGSSLHWWTTVSATNSRPHDVHQQGSPVHCQASDSTGELFKAPPSSAASTKASTCFENLGNSCYIACGLRCILAAASDGESSYSFASKTYPNLLNFGLDRRSDAAAQWMSMVQSVRASLGHQEAGHPWRVLQLYTAHFNHEVAQNLCWLNEQHTACAVCIPRCHTFTIKDFKPWELETSDLADMRHWEPFAAAVHFGHHPTQGHWMALQATDVHQWILHDDKVSTLLHPVLVSKPLRHYRQIIQIICLRAPRLPGHSPAMSATARPASFSDFRLQGMPQDAEQSRQIPPGVPLPELIFACFKWPGSDHAKLVIPLPPKSCLHDVLLSMDMPADFWEYRINAAQRPISCAILSLQSNATIHVRPRHHGTKVFCWACRAAYRCAKDEECALCFEPLTGLCHMCQAIFRMCPVCYSSQRFRTVRMTQTEASSAQRTDAQLILAHLQSSMQLATWPLITLEWATDFPDSAALTARCKPGSTLLDLMRNIDCSSRWTLQNSSAHCIQLDQKTCKVADKPATYVVRLKQRGVPPPLSTMCYHNGAWPFGYAVHCLLCGHASRTEHQRRCPHCQAHVRSLCWLCYQATTACIPCQAVQRLITLARATISSAVNDPSMPCSSDEPTAGSTTGCDRMLPTGGAGAAERSGRSKQRSTSERSEAARETLTSDSSAEPPTVHQGWNNALFPQAARTGDETHDNPQQARTICVSALVRRNRATIQHLCGTFLAPTTVFHVLNAFLCHGRSWIVLSTDGIRMHKKQAITSHSQVSVLQEYPLARILHLATILRPCQSCFQANGWPAEIACRSCPNHKIILCAECHIFALAQGMPFAANEHTNGTMRACRSRTHRLRQSSTRVSVLDNRMQLEMTCLSTPANVPRNAFANTGSSCYIATVLQCLCAVLTPPADAPITMLHFILRNLQSETCATSLHAWQLALNMMHELGFSDQQPGHPWSVLQSLFDHPSSAVNDQSSALQPGTAQPSVGMLDPTLQRRQDSDQQTTVIWLNQQRSSCALRIHRHHSITYKDSRECSDQDVDPHFDPQWNIVAAALHMGERADSGHWYSMRNLGNGLWTQQSDEIRSPCNPVARRPFTCSMRSSDVQVLFPDEMWQASPCWIRPHSAFEPEQQQPTPQPPCRSACRRASCAPTTLPPPMAHWRCRR